METIGFTCTDVPDTVPIPLIVDVTWSLDVADHDRVVDWPLLTVGGAAVNDVIVGGLAGTGDAENWTATVETTGTVVVPAVSAILYCHQRDAALVLDGSAAPVHDTVVPDVTHPVVAGDSTVHALPRPSLVDAVLIPNVTAALAVADAVLHVTARSWALASPVSYGSESSVPEDDGVR